MGRLRGDKDNEFWQSINNEVFDLFGNFDGYLYILNRKKTLNQGTDPLYGEPDTVESFEFEKFQVQFFLEEPIEDDAVSEFGDDIQFDATGYVNRRDLEDRNVPVHGSRTFEDRIVVGDVIEVYREGATAFYDVIGVNRTGYLNDTSEHTYYRLSLKRNRKFAPERKTDPNC